MHLINILLAQINPYTANIKKNVGKHIEYIKLAKQEGARLVIFPELSLTGYFLKDSIYDVGINLNTDEIEVLEPLFEAGRENGISVIAGFVEKDESYNFYNSSLCISQGKVINVHRKVYLPTYGMFEELRYFKPGKGFGVFELPREVYENNPAYKNIKGNKKGYSTDSTRPPYLAKASILTCEDAWHLSSSYIAVNKGANIIIVNSASPARGLKTGFDKFSSINMWEELLSVTAFYYKSYVLYANRVGFEDGIGFSGGSCIFTPQGEIDGRLDYLEEGSLKVQINLDLLNNERFKTPLLRDEDLYLTHRELEDIINSKR